MGCYAWSLPEVPATSDKYFWVKSSSSVDSIWNDLPQDHIDRSILSFTKRLRACIKANDGHFEYRVWLTNCILVATICCTSCQISADWQHYEYCIVLHWKFSVLRCQFLKCLVTFFWWFWYLIDKITTQSFSNVYVSHLILYLWCKFHGNIPNDCQDIANLLLGYFNLGHPVEPAMQIAYLKETSTTPHEYDHSQLGFTANVMVVINRTRTDRCQKSAVLLHFVHALTLQTQACVAMYTGRPLPTHDQRVNYFTQTG